MTPAAATASACPTALPNGSSRICANAGSPTAPMPIEANVMPTWQLAMYSSMRSTCWSASSAPRAPSSFSASILSRRARTSAYSAATKKAFMRMSAGTARRSTAVTARLASACYFEEVRRRSFAARARLAEHPGGESAPPAGQCDDQRMATKSSSIVTAVDFAGIPTKDVPAAAEFFGSTLGLRRSVYMPDRGFAEFETGNLTLSVWNPEQMGLEHHPNPNPLALHVDDVEAARRALEERGVEFQGETLDTGVCHMAFFRDPDGNSFMLHHRYAPRHTEAS